MGGIEYIIHWLGKVVDFKWFVLVDCIRKHLPEEKIRFPLGITQITSPPIPPGMLYNFFYNVLACISEPSNDDYDNDGSDNYDYNFGTFDDFGVKMTKKYTHHMILMSRYKGELRQRTKKFGQGPP